MNKPSLGMEIYLIPYKLQCFFNEMMESQKSAKHGFWWYFLKYLEQFYNLHGFLILFGDKVDYMSFVRPEPHQATNCWMLLMQQTNRTKCSPESLSYTLGHP